jgi:hypothetical protein
LLQDFASRHASWSSVRDSAHTCAQRSAAESEGAPHSEDLASQRLVQSFVESLGVAPLGTAESPEDEDAPGSEEHPALAHVAAKRAEARRKQAEGDIDIVGSCPGFRSRSAIRPSFFSSIESGTWRMTRMRNRIHGGRVLRSAG